MKSYMDFYFLGVNIGYFGLVLTKKKSNQIEYFLILTETKLNEQSKQNSLDQFDLIFHL